VRTDSNRPRETIKNREKKPGTHSKGKSFGGVSVRLGEWRVRVKVTKKFERGRLDPRMGEAWRCDLGVLQNSCANREKRGLSISRKNTSLGETSETTVIAGNFCELSHDNQICGTGSKIGRVTVIIGVAPRVKKVCHGNRKRPLGGRGIAMIIISEEGHLVKFRIPLAWGRKPFLQQLKWS